MLSHVRPSLRFLAAWLLHLAGVGGWCWLALGAPAALAADGADPRADTGWFDTDTGAATDTDPFDDTDTDADDTDTDADDTDADDTDTDGGDATSDTDLPGLLLTEANPVTAGRACSHGPGTASGGGAGALGLAVLLGALLRRRR
jgi:MYXO-CTERM domain-containing protein